jgi:hypothetical protein
VFVHTAGAVDARTKFGAAGVNDMPNSESWLTIAAIGPTAGSLMRRLNAKIASATRKVACNFAGTAKPAFFTIRLIERIFLL